MLFKEIIMLQNSGTQNWEDYELLKLSPLRHGNPDPVLRIRNVVPKSTEIFTQKIIQISGLVQNTKVPN
jgi:hypothetical protein